jgi:tetratricopeptide (TPR) repeat protein
VREAYELAARAYVATGELAAGLEWAKRSLRLMPENPFLLVMIADTAARQRDFDLASTSARDALRHLEHAAPPSPIAREHWPAVRAKMRATALFVLGRVAAVGGQYKEAEQALLASLTLNPDDIEAPYTIGVVRERRERDVRAVPHEFARSSGAAYAACREQRGRPLRVVPHAAHHGRAAVSREDSRD